MQFRFGAGGGQAMPHFFFLNGYLGSVRCLDQIWYVVYILIREKIAMKAFFSTFLVIFATALTHTHKEKTISQHNECFMFGLFLVVPTRPNFVNSQPSQAVNFAPIAGIFSPSASFGVFFSFICFIYSITATPSSL